MKAAIIWALSLCMVACRPNRTVSQIDDRRTNEMSIPLGIIEPDIPAGSELSAGRIALGRELFFEPSISKSKTTSCSSCHMTTHGFSDKLEVTVRSEATTFAFPLRNSISVVNSGFQATLGWDGKFRTLEQQVIGSFQPYGDMGIDIGTALERLQGTAFEEKFDAVFKDGLTAINFAVAIATFERSLISGDTRFDKYLFKGDSTQLNDAEIRGYELFIGKGGCIACHDVFHPSVNSLGGAFALFTDHRFHNLGIGYNAGRMNDVGRFEVTKDEADWGAFKTPSLRNVELTPPYMHDGSLKTLQEVVEFYNRGGNQNPNITSGLKQLYLTSQEMSELIEFLSTLTDERFR